MTSILQENGSRMKRLVAVVLLLAFAPARAEDKAKPDDGVPVYNTVTDTALAGKRIEIFRRELRDLGFAGTLKSCSQMVELSVGPPDGDHSFGAFCMLAPASRKPLTVMICDDDMVGHFTLMRSEVPDEAEPVAIFTQQNCFGG
jgi:hypothetical protein